MDTYMVLTTRGGCISLKSFLVRVVEAPTEVLNQGECIPESSGRIF